MTPADVFLLGFFVGCLIVGAIAYWVVLCERRAILGRYTDPEREIAALRSRIARVTNLLEASAEPFDNACSILRGTKL